MIDTIKLMFDETQYENRNYHFKLSLMRGRMRTGVLNQSAQDKRNGIYMPKLTLIEQPYEGSRRTILTVEFSAPKLLLGNNFEELNDEDLPALCVALSNRLKRVDINITPKTIQNARVVSVHFSKNMKLPGHYSCQNVVDRVSKANLPKIFARRTTYFERGLSYQVHTNAKDIVVYDKVADLERTKVSDKRGIERDNWMQRKLDGVVAHNILRFEVRLNGARQVKAEFKQDQQLKDIFSWEISRTVLAWHWNIITKGLDALPDEKMDLLNLLEALGPDLVRKGPQSAIAQAAVLHMTNESGISAVRAAIESLFGNHAWRRFRPLFEIPGGKHDELIALLTIQLLAFNRISPDDLSAEAIN